MKGAKESRLYRYRKCRHRRCKFPDQRRQASEMRRRPCCVPEAHSRNRPKQVEVGWGHRWLHLALAQAPAGAREVFRGAGEHFVQLVLAGALAGAVKWALAGAVKGALARSQVRLARSQVRRRAEWHHRFETLEQNGQVFRGAGEYLVQLVCWPRCSWKGAHLCMAEMRGRRQTPPRQQKKLHPAKG